jgi:hypothetical protein
MVVYLSKPMIMRINPYVGYQGWEGIEWWTCARAKYDYEALMTSSLSDCTWLEREWKFRLSTTWHPSLHFFIFLSHLIDPSHIFLATPLLSLFSFSSSITLFHSLIHIYFFLYFSFSFFLFRTHIFLLTFPSLDIFLSFQSCQLLSFLHNHNLKFKIKPC